MTGGEILALELFGIGVFIHIAKSLATNDGDNWKMIVGKAILNGFTSMMAGVLLLWSSTIPVVAIIGVAAIIGTLGSEYTIKTIKRYVGRKIDTL